ncbi:BTB/POZ/MATH-domain protein [Rhynchospora pubera]|uniref:BTB/POZ/MATH-domain protein n=1 Tax=Rhynchospora pubera TaxID=906938 RepID=A0AAV8FQS9_9POAL|nr:BTB/POZ/MATH-domain protein [Rhynchospora pubera]
MLSSVVDTRKSETASTWFTETSTGSHLFKITGYLFTKGNSLGNYITSDIFTVGGYNWAIRYYPGSKGNQDFIAFDLDLRSDAEARVKITFTLLSQTEGMPSKSYSSGAETLRRNGSGGWFFINKQEFEVSQYLKDDSFTIRCTVTVFKCSGIKKTNCHVHPFAVQPSNIHQQLTGLLERGDGTDVSFKVSGVTFDAHRCVLSAISPVFRAQFFGPMKGNVNQSIEIKDMEPSIFKSMLHFIYSDSVPELEEGKDNKNESIVVAQHLLVAADRYGLERLKQLCEKKMWEFMDVNNFATTLTLAEQHNCSELKDACMEFIKQPEVLGAVVRTEGFRDMIISCPTILEELCSKSH